MTALLKVSFTCLPLIDCLKLYAIHTERLVIFGRSVQIQYNGANDEVVEDISQLLTLKLSIDFGQFTEMMNSKEGSYIGLVLMRKVANRLFAKNVIHAIWTNVSTKPTAESIHCRQSSLQATWQSHYSGANTPRISPFALGFQTTVIFWDCMPSMHWVICSFSGDIKCYLRPASSPKD